MDDKTLSDLLSLSLTRPKRPRFKIFSFFVRYFSFIQGAIITLILFLSAFSLSPLWVTVILISYWLYFLLKAQVRKREAILGIPYESEQSYFIRSLLLIFGVFIFLFVLNKYTDYPKSDNTDTLWLLLLLP